MSKLSSLLWLRDGAGFATWYQLILVTITPVNLYAQQQAPPRLVYTTYATSQPYSALYAFAVDSSGYAYLGGTYSGCAFLTKLNPPGTAAVWSMCLPVSQVTSVALDQQGYIYVTGIDQSQPVSTTVVKLSPSAQQTIYSTSIAGSVDKIVVDRRGNAYIVGVPSKGFQATPGAYLTTGGSSFAAKLDGSGAIQYATYLDLVGTAVHGNPSAAVDSQGNLWVVGAICGFTCFGSAYHGSETASAVKKLAESGALLVSKTFGGIGSSETNIWDQALGVAIDGNDSVWVVGVAESAYVPTTPGSLEPNWPATLGPLGSNRGGLGYAVKYSSSGALLYGTYVGINPGGPDLSIASVALDNQGRPYFALNSAAPNVEKSTSTVMGLGADGSTVLFSMGFNSFVQQVALDGSGGLELAGNTSRMAFVTSPGTYQALYPGGANAGYAARFDLTSSAPAQFTIMVNAASFLPGYNPYYPEGAVAPGEIVTLFGQNLPSNPKVTFDGVAAPILYADSKQINAVVPFEVSAPSTTVLLEGVRGYVVPVWPAVPALFTADGSGMGQLAAVNEDGTVNSKTNPAKAGSVVSVYLTGMGAMMPPIGDGQLGPLQPPYPVPVLGVSALVDGIEAPVLFVGQAPGLMAGAVQVNVRIPSSVRSGNVGLGVHIGNYQTQFGTTIAVE